MVTSISRKFRVIVIKRLLFQKWQISHFNFTAINLEYCKNHAKIQLLLTYGQERQKLQERGILTVPGAKIGFKFPDKITDLITQFYNIKQRGEKLRVQKRLVYCNLKVGFSKFAELRPKECVLAGASGTHTVCVCIIHQNVKLMIEGQKKKILF